MGSFSGVDPVDGLFGVDGGDEAGSGSTALGRKEARKSTVAARNFWIAFLRAGLSRIQLAGNNGASNECFVDLVVFGAALGKGFTWVLTTRSNTCQLGGKT